MECELINYLIIESEKQDEDYLEEEELILKKFDVVNKRDYLLTQVAIFPCVWFYYLSLNTSSIWQPNYQKQCLVFDKRHFPVFYKQHYPVFNNCLTTAGREQEKRGRGEQDDRGDVGQ